MKILHIIRSAKQEGGGPIESIIQLTSACKSLGHNFEVVSLDSTHELHNQSLPFKVHALGPSKGKYGFNSIFKDWLFTNASNYNAFIIHGLWQYHSFAAHSVLKSLNLPYFLYTHGMLDPWFKKRYPLKHIKKYLYWLWGEYPVIRDAKKVLFTCEEEKKLASQSFRPYKCNDLVVNFGTAGCHGDISEQKNLFFNHYPQLADKPFLLFLSRIHPKKGVDLLIEALAALQSTSPETHIVIAGPDQVGWKSKLQQIADSHRIGDKITWTGMLKDDIKWGAYHSADAFILPSHQENFGIVVAEALSCRLPVLITDKINIWREIAQDEAGLVETDSLQGTLQLIKNWQNLTKEQKDLMRFNAYNCFKNRFEIGKAAESLINAISDN